MGERMGVGKRVMVGFEIERMRVEVIGGLGGDGALLSLLLHQVRERGEVDGRHGRKRGGGSRTGTRR